MSHKTITVNDQLSKNKVKKIGGFNNIQALHFVLIGQLGKHIEGDQCRSKITSREILDYAFEVIYESSSLIPCRCVLVECNENEKVWKSYLDYGFKEFQFDGEHYQFYKIL